MIFESCPVFFSYNIYIADATRFATATTNTPNTSCETVLTILQPQILAFTERTRMNPAHYKDPLNASTVMSATPTVD